MFEKTFMQPFDQMLCLHCGKRQDFLNANLPGSQYLSIIHSKYMKSYLFACTLLVLLSACQDKQDTEEQTSRLVGRWQLAAVQDTANTWQDVTYESGVMHIFANGSVAFATIDGVKMPTLGCCSPAPYQTKGDKAILLKYFPENCALVYCIARSPSDQPQSFSWRVESIDAQLLEVATGNPSPRRLRYRKLD